MFSGFNQTGGGKRIDRIEFSLPAQIKQMHRQTKMTRAGRKDEGEQQQNMER